VTPLFHIVALIASLFHIAALIASLSLSLFLLYIPGKRKSASNFVLFIPMSVRLSRKKDSPIGSRAFVEGDTNTKRSQEADEQESEGKNKEDDATAQLHILTLT
jgi:hypothetical protein